MIRRTLAWLTALTLALILAGCGAAGVVSSSMVRSCEAAHYDALAWSPDGKLIAFQAQGLDDPSMIGVIKPDGTGLRQLVSSPRNQLDVQWLPDSRTIAFNDSRNIHTVTLDGERSEITPTDRSIVNARFSPDGQSVAYSQYGFGALGEQALVGMSIASRDGSQVTDLTNALEIFGAWSPDGTRIAYVQVSGQSTMVSVMRPDGGGKIALAEGTGPIQWSPDGEWISYIGFEGGNGINIVRPDGTGEKRVIAELGATEYAWLPDSRHISHVALPPYFLTVIDIDTLAAQTITAVGASFKTPPAWSPDGAQVAIIGIDIANNGLEDIYVASRDGAGLTRLTDNPGKYQCMRLPF